jgi:hypothetical protein
MKLVNEYNTPMGVMRHEVAYEVIEKEEINTLCPTHKDRWDRIAFVVGAVFIAWMVTSIVRLIWRFW